MISINSNHKYYYNYKVQSYELLLQSVCSKTLCNSDSNSSYRLLHVYKINLKLIKVAILTATYIYIYTYIFIFIYNI